MSGIEPTLREYKKGTLHSSSGQKVTNKKQAIAIGLSEERKMAGKSMKPGGGGRFAKLKGELAHKKGIKNPGAVAAAIGRKKYGAEKMAKFSAQGKARIHHKPGGNARIDMGEVGEGAPHDEMAEVPSSEMHSARNAPHKMSIADMYAPADPTHHLHSLAEHHATEAAKYAGMGEEHRAMADHHRGMMHAMHDQIRAGMGHSHLESLPGALGSHPASPGQTAHYGEPSPLAHAKSVIKGHPKGGMKF